MVKYWWSIDIEKPARLIIRLSFGFVFDSVFVKLNKNENEYWGGNTVYINIDIMTPLYEISFFNKITQNRYYVCRENTSESFFEKMK